MNVNIVNDALKYYDENNDKYRQIKKKIKFVKHDVLNKNDIEGTRLVFYDKDMKELFTSRIEILGNYYNTINMWIWGWSLPSINKSLTSIIRKVFLYGTDIDLNKSIANVMLKNELVTSRFKVDDDIQVDIHCAIASYLAKKPFVFAWKDITLKSDAPLDVKGDDYEGATITHYIFIVDPPAI